MAVYTYEVDHGDESPEVYAGMTINGGRVVAVVFEPVLDEFERLQESQQDADTHIIVNGHGVERGRGTLQECERLTQITGCADHRIVPITKEK